MGQSFYILLKSYIDSDMLGKGIFWGLFLLSMICWIVIIYKFWTFKTLKNLSSHFLKGLENPKQSILNLSFNEGVLRNNFIQVDPYAALYQKMKSKTLTLLEKNQYFITKRGENDPVFLSKDDIRLIEQELGSTLISEMKQVDRGLFMLNTSVSLAPFLGILGTVWGILLSLFEMQKGSSAFSNMVIIQGLSTALATTVLGLLIAIPALIGHSVLKSISKGIWIDLEHFANQLLSLIELQYRKVD